MKRQKRVKRQNLVVFKFMLAGARGPSTHEQSDNHLECRYLPRVLTNLIIQKK